MSIADAHRELFETVVARASGRGERVFLVGGGVRDLLRNLPLQDSDLDLSVEGDAIRFAEELRESIGGDLERFPAFLTAKIRRPAAFPALDEIDFASCRKERYPRPGQLPEVEPASLEEDLLRRDFTINALALAVDALINPEAGGGKRNQVDGMVIDLTGGKEDLKQRIVRILHEESFLDDPTRIFRGIRYRGRLKGDYDPGTEHRMTEAIEASALSTVSNRRILNELRKIFQERRSAAMFRELHERGILGRIPFLATRNHQALFESLERLDLHVDDIPAELKEEAGLGLALAHDDGSDPIARFAALGIGKKFMRSLIGDLQVGRVDASTSDRALLLQACLDEGETADAAVEEFARRRAESGRSRRR